MSANQTAAKSDLSGPVTLRTGRVNIALALAALVLTGGLLFSVDRMVAGFPTPLLAVLSGLALGRLLRSGPLAAAARIAAKWFLRAGIVLLGLRVSFSQLQEVGLSAFSLIVPAIGVGFTVAFFLGRMRGLESRLSLLLAAGTAICGNSAIMAAAPVLDAEEDEVVVSVSAITIYGTFALLFFPLVGALLGMGQERFGRWVGTAINDTSQVVGASFAFGEVAGTNATVVKLARNLFIIPLIFGLSLVGARWRTVRDDPSRIAQLRRAVPVFVLGFVALVVANSVFEIPESARDLGGELSKVLILTALIGVGLGASQVALRKRGVLPLTIGVFAGLALALVTLVLLHLGVG